MTSEQTDQPTPRKQLRVWPGVVLAVLLLLSMFALPAVRPGALIYGLMGGAACALGVIVWWVFFSRARWAERVGVIVLTAVAIYATRFVVHESIAGAGMRMMFPVLGVM